MKKLWLVLLLATAGLGMTSCGSENTSGHTHNWGEWEVTIAANCIAIGEETKACTLDPSHIETRIVPIDTSAHDWKAWNTETEPTCEEPGIGERICDLCGEFDSGGVLPPIGHKWGEWEETIAATETEDGEETRTCIRDSAHTDTRPIPALNHTHDWGDWEVTRPATETEDGEESRICAANPAHIDTRPIPALNHTHAWGEWEVTTAPTCTTGGVETRVCSLNTSHIETRNTSIINDAHDWGEWTVVGDEEKRVCNHNPAHYQTRPITAMTFTSISDLGNWLSSQPENAPDEPYEIILNVNNLGGAYNVSGSLGKTLIDNDTKYVSIDLSGSTFTSTGNMAFRACASLTAIILPDTVQSIGDQAFFDCTKLASVNIPDGVTSIGYGAFRTNAITSIVIPDSVTSAIGDSTFQNCAQLENATIGNQVMGIGTNAFTGTSLASIIIPASVKSIGTGAFGNNQKLASVTFEGTLSPTAGFANANSFVGNLRAAFYNDDADNGTPGKYTTTAPVYSSAVWSRE
jgi:hypothetical protein